MADTRADELRQMDEDELATQLSEARKELFNLRFRNVTGQLDNSSALTRARRDIARILTIQRHREIEAAEAADLADRPAPVEVVAATDQETNDG